MSYFRITEGENYGKFQKYGETEVLEGADVPVKELHRIVSEIFIIEDLGHSIVTQENLLEFLDEDNYPNLVRIENSERPQVAHGHKVREPQLKPRFLCVLRILAIIRSKYQNQNLDF